MFGRRSKELVSNSLLEGMEPKSRPETGPPYRRTKKPAEDRPSLSRLVPIEILNEQQQQQNNNLI